MNDPHNNDLSRRKFLGHAVGSVGAMSVGASILGNASPADAQEAVAETIEGLPTRVLGRTGRRVTILGLGTAPIGEGPVETPQAARIFAEVIDRGVNYVDTARGYGNAEEALGTILPGRRDKIFLVTKLWTDRADRAEQLLNESLRTLKVDMIDMVHIHHVGGKNVQQVLADDGILPFLVRQKEKGTIKYIGMSGHCRPARFLEVLKTGLIDVVMPVMNYADRNTYNFEGMVLPECVRQNVGVVAMKVYAGIKGGFRNHRNGGVGCATPLDLLPQAMSYALDLPGVAVANIGPYTMEQAIANVKLAKNYKPLTPEQRRSLLAFGKNLAEEMGPRYGPVE